MLKRHTDICTETLLSCGSQPATLAKLFTFKGRVYVSVSVCVCVVVWFCVCVCGGGTRPLDLARTCTFCHSFLH